MSPLQSLLNPAAADDTMMLMGLAFIAIMVFAAYKIFRIIKRHTRKAKRYAAMYASLAAVSGGSLTNVGGIPEQIGMILGF